VDRDKDRDPYKSKYMEKVHFLTTTTISFLRLFQGNIVFSILTELVGA
jgi:hypothetical protein